MKRSSTDDLVDSIVSQANYIKKIPRVIDLRMAEAVMKWKSLVAEACLSLVLNPAPASSDTTAQPPDTNYIVDLRAGVKILPQRFHEERKPIDTAAKSSRIEHEQEIEQGKIKCYKMNEKGEQFQFKLESTNLNSLVSRREMSHEAPTFVERLRKFTYGDTIRHIQRTTYEPAYLANCCAYPNCGSTQGINSNITHLQLCEHHETELKNNLDYKWIPPMALENYKKIKAQGEIDCKESHNRIYYQLLPHLDKWIEQIDSIISTNCSGVGSRVSAVDAWLVLELRSIRQVLMLMKSFIFIYRMHLNLNPLVIQAIIALGVNVLEDCRVRDATAQAIVRMIRCFCGIVSTIFLYFGIGILYTLDMIITDDAYLAIILKVAGGTLMVIGGILAFIFANPLAIIGGIAAFGTGLTSNLIGRRMERARNNRGTSHPHLIEIHLELSLARERLWQWIGNE